MVTIPLIAYLLVVLGIAFYASRKATAQDYLICSRALGAFALGLSIAAGFFDSFVLVTFTGYVYRYGWPALSLFLGTAAGLILFSVFAPRLRTESGEKSYFGMSDYFEHRYGHVSAIVVSIINLVFYVALLLIQIIFGSILLAHITGLSYNVCVGAIAVTLLIYVGIGGFRAVVMTDIFQWSLIAILLVLVAFIVARMEVVPSMAHAEWSSSFGDAIAFLLIGCMASFSAPELWQRCFAARDARSARRGILLAALLFPLAGLVLVVVGLAATANFPGIDPQDALIRVFDASLTGGLQAVGLVLLLAAIMSSADTCLFVIAPTFVINILGTKGGTDRKMPTFLMMGIALVLASLGALLTQDLLQIALALASLSLGIFPVLFVGLKTRLPSGVVNVAMISGFVVVGIALAAGSLDPATSVLSLPVSFVIVGGWLVVSRLFRKPKPKETSAEHESEEME